MSLSVEAPNDEPIPFLAFLRFPLESGDPRRPLEVTYIDFMGVRRTYKATVEEGLSKLGIPDDVLEYMTDKFVEAPLREATKRKYEFPPIKTLALRICDAVPEMWKSGETGLFPKASEQVRNFIVHVKLNEDNKYAHAIALDFFHTPITEIRDIVDLKILERLSAGGIRPEEFNKPRFLTGLKETLENGDKTLIDVYKYVTETNLSLYAII